MGAQAAVKRASTSEGRRVSVPLGCRPTSNGGAIGGRTALKAAASPSGPDASRGPARDPDPNPEAGATDAVPDADSEQDPVTDLAARRRASRP